MNSSERYIARLLFLPKIYMSDGQEYENLFVNIMQNANKNFKPVKPQGKYGDRKNDGFDKESGTYYQVYAPENSSNNLNNTIKKLTVDFKGLYKYWNKISPIKMYFFALNDKYKGTYHSLEEKLSEIEKEYVGIKCSSFLSKNLEDVFFELSDEQIVSVLGPLPDPLNISDVNFGAMNEVINHLMGMKFAYNEERIPKNPDFDKKIVFNNLSESVASLLNQGNYQNHVIKDYFEKNSISLKSDIKEIFVNYYSNGVKEVNNDINKSDAVFFYILTKASPKRTRPVQDAVLVLMAYYFECCDIFQTPPLKEKN
ncbi:MAG: hypothetical protein P9X22_02275 [Candidatus Zapsychrus exili]|nr:hypothetical protein [Candidatus Zapsychrus exili]